MNKLAFEKIDWFDKCAEVIHQNILYFLERDGYCSVILTGGRTAEQVYKRLTNYLSQYKGEIDFFIGDERCVLETDSESNYGMILNSLIKGHPIRINKFYHSSLSIEDNLKKYEDILPILPNLLILGLGDDGHIASLFPGSDYSNIKNRVITTISPQGQQRVTITPGFILSAERIVLLAFGPNKKEIVSKISHETKPEDVPAKWAYDALWLTMK